MNMHFSNAFRIAVTRTRACQAVALSLTFLSTVPPWSVEASTPIAYVHPHRTALYRDLPSFRSATGVLLGYDVNAVEGVNISPYVLVRFDGEIAAVRVYLADETLINSRLFYCRENQFEHPGFGICNSLPAGIQTPVRIQIALWKDSLLGKQILATDSFSVLLPQPATAHLAE